MLRNQFILKFISVIPDTGKIRMPGWISGMLLFIAGFITSFFIAHDALNFKFIQMVVAVLLFTLIVALIVALIVFWPLLRSWFKRIIKRRKNL